MVHVEGEEEDLSDSGESDFEPIKLDGLDQEIVPVESFDDPEENLNGMLDRLAEQYGTDRTRLLLLLEQMLHINVRASNDAPRNSIDDKKRYDLLLTMATSIYLSFLQ